MARPENLFKKRLLAGETQIGFWLALAHPYAAEICATAGFDWLLIDGEHAPNDINSILAQLQAIAPYASQAIVRPPVGTTDLIKQILDVGAQTLLIPMVESADQARELVTAIHYPPKGVRGVGSALARASRWNREPGYLQNAGEDLCLLVQIESRAGLDALDEIAAVPGIDGIFIGPSDLSASLGFPGNAAAPEVQSAIENAVARIRKAGRAAGIVTTEERLVRRYMEIGCNFIAVGFDISLLVQATGALAKTYMAMAKNSKNQ